MFVMRTIPVADQAASEADPLSRVRHDDFKAINTSTVSETSTIPTRPSHGLQEHGLGSRSDPVIDSFEEEEVISEVARIMIEDIENGVVDPTLAMLGAEDVELDMDDIYVYEDDDLSDSSSEGSVDGG